MVTLKGYPGQVRSDPIGTLHRTRRTSENIANHIIELRKMASFAQFSFQLAVRPGRCLVNSIGKSGANSLKKGRHSYINYTRATVAPACVLVRGVHWAQHTRVVECALQSWQRAIR